VAKQANAMFNGAFKSKIVLGSDKAGIELPGTYALYTLKNMKICFIIMTIYFTRFVSGEEVSVVSLDEELADFTDKEISDFVSPDFDLPPVISFFHVLVISS
jgi:hypothetical protein